MVSKHSQHPTAPPSKRDAIATQGRPESLPRRGFFSTSAAFVGGVLAASGESVAADTPTPSAESLASLLHESLTARQRESVCRPWDFVDPKFGLLRTRVANNWNCTDTDLSSDFFTADQRAIVRAIFEQLISPDWHDRFDRQLEDDTGGFGHGQSIALLGEPGSGRFQFLLTGRHMTLRCDGDSADHVAFGGPIFYGHDAGGFDEPKDHPGNVFWPQALAANALYAMLDGRQRSAALVERAPAENAISFRGGGQPATDLTGISMTDLSMDQREELARILGILVEPFRASDGDEVRRCLERQGGLDACRLTFYREGDIGEDGIWDNWRLEGPAFVWHFRGAPHVHVWVHVADDPTVVANA